MGAACRFRKQALKYHPALNNSESAKEEFVNICEAYDVLSNGGFRCNLLHAPAAHALHSHAVMKRRPFPPCCQALTTPPLHFGTVPLLPFVCSQV